MNIDTCFVMGVKSMVVRQASTTDMPSEIYYIYKASRQACVKSHVF